MRKTHQAPKTKTIKTQ